MERGLFDLTGRIALVTGGTRGLGRAMATGLARAGARVVINGRTSQESLDAAVEAFREEGFEVFGYLFDVTNPEAVREAVAWIEAEVGPIDILVNNAGIMRRANLAEMPVTDFEEVIRVDLVAPFVVAQTIVRGMIERGRGKIINVCSMMSELGRDTVGAYAAAKGGLKMLTRNMATEWARYNIQVNGIGPGYFATDMTAALRTPGHPFDAFIVSRTPARRWGDPDELHGAVVFLASDASSFVNGQILYVDGGLLASIGRPSDD